MLENSVSVSVEFYFKGQKFDLTTTMNLEQLAALDGDDLFCYHALAKVAGLDVHGYEVDVMMAEPLTYSEPQGLMKLCVEYGQMNWDKLLDVWKEKETTDAVSRILLSEFNIDDAKAHPKLAKALLLAYEVGRKK